MKIRDRKMRWLWVAVSALMVFVSVTRLSVVTSQAEETDDKNKKKEVKYELDPEVKEWLDQGNSIPGSVKYASLSGSTHLWEVDSTDISDAKVELIGNDERRIVGGIELRDWLRCQRFYGEKMAQDPVKFKRPGGTVEF